jgi:hypothetical protein
MINQRHQSGLEYLSVSLIDLLPSIRDDACFTDIIEFRMGHLSGLESLWESVRTTCAMFSNDDNFSETNVTYAHERIIKNIDVISEALKSSSLIGNYRIDLSVSNFVINGVIPSLAEFLGQKYGLNGLGVILGCIGISSGFINTNAKYALPQDYQYTIDLYSKYGWGARREVAYNDYVQLSNQFRENVLPMRYPADNTPIITPRGSFFGNIIC